MYWIEMHIHTECGSLDSTLNVKELMDEYKRLGIDGVCITEHVKWEKITEEEYKSLYGVFDEAQKMENCLDVFPGAEVKLPNNNEYLVLGIKIPYEWFELDWIEAIEKIHECGEIIIKSHPYRDEGYVEPIDGIEKYNFCSSYSMNKMACEFVRKNSYLIWTIGCDAHSSDVVGMAITILEERPKNGRDLVKMLKENRIKGYILAGNECRKEDIDETIFNCTYDS